MAIGRLVEALAASRSPLDIQYDEKSGWSATQLNAYCRAVLITFESYIDGHSWGYHSYALYRAFGTIEHSCSELYKLDGLKDYYHTDQYARLQTVLTFLKNAIALLEKYKPRVKKLRHRGDRELFNEDYYDLIAEHMFKLMTDAGYIKGPPDTCWSVQHNAIWYALYSFHEGKALDVVRFKVRRLIYNELLELQEFPNFKSSRILGYCLAVMGLVVGDKKGYGRESYGLRRFVLNWTKKNFLSLYKAQPNVAETRLLGAITFDKKNGRLVKTYPLSLDLKPHREFLKLDPASAGAVKPPTSRKSKKTASK
jgi:hypothetical protein